MQEHNSKNKVRFMYAAFAMMHIKNYFVRTAQVRASSVVSGTFLTYIASSCHRHREAAFNIFAQHFSDFPIVAGGRCHGMYPHLSSRVSGKWDSINHTSKFFLAMENTRQSGYVTEKIVNAFLFGAIPIYYGSNDVYKLFNKRAFIMYDTSNPSSTVRRIAYLHRNITAYIEMRSLPFLAESFEEHAGTTMIHLIQSKLCGLLS